MHHVDSTSELQNLLAQGSIKQLVNDTNTVRKVEGLLGPDFIHCGPKGNSLINSICTAYL